MLIPCIDKTKRFKDASEVNAYMKIIIAQSNVNVKKNLNKTVKSIQTAYIKFETINKKFKLQVIR